MLWRTLSWRTLPTELPRLCIVQEMGGRGEKHWLLCACVKHCRNLQSQLELLTMCSS